MKLQLLLLSVLQTEEGNMQKATCIPLTSFPSFIFRLAKITVNYYCLSYPQNSEYQQDLGGALIPSIIPTQVLPLDQWSAHIQQEILILNCLKNGMNSSNASKQIRPFWGLQTFFNNKRNKNYFKQETGFIYCGYYYKKFKLVLTVK